MTSDVARQLVLNVSAESEAFLHGRFPLPFPEHFPSPLSDFNSKLLALNNQKKPI